MVVRTAERPIGNSVRPFGSPVPKPRSGPPDLDRPKQYEWPQSTTLLASLRCGSDDERALNNASFYLAGRRDRAREPEFCTRTFSTPGKRADETPSQMDREQAFIRCQHELDEANGECDEWRKRAVFLQSENIQLQIYAALCEGLTAPEWRGNVVDLQKENAQLAKELRAKNVESDELRLQNHGLKEAHGTAVEALEAFKKASQRSHAAVLLDRDQLLSVFGSESQDSLDEWTTSNAIADAPSHIAPPPSLATPSTKLAAQSVMSVVRSESDKSGTSFTMHGEDGYDENDAETNTSVCGNDDLAIRHVESGDNTGPDDKSRNADGFECLYYLTVPPRAKDRAILAGLGRDVWHVCVWDSFRSQLTFEGGSAAPSHIDRSDVEWARLKLYSKPSRSGSVATEQDMCDMARRTTGELSGIGRSRVPVAKGKLSKAYCAVARGHNVGIYHHFVEVQQQTDGYTGALFMAFLTLDEAQLWFDENRAVQLGVDIPAATHSPIPRVATGPLAYPIAAFSESSRGGVSGITARGSSDKQLLHRPNIGEASIKRVGG